MHEQIKTGICEAAKKLLARGVTPKRLVMHPKTGSVHGIHATHVLTPSGELKLVYTNGAADGVITVDGDKVTIESESVNTVITEKKDK